MGSNPSDVIDETLDAGTNERARELAAGARLGKYKLDRVLGTGGMGVVWAAHDPDLDRAVALKVLRYEQAGPELRQRLLREARAMAKLKHPNVLTVYEVGSEGDRDYIAMELVDGASLDEWIAQKPARDEIWHALIAAGRGLAAAHHAGLVHRDFKPHNVLRGKDGRVLVTDFGLARGHGGDEPQPAGIALTETLPIRGGVGLAETIDATPTPAIAMPNTGQLTRTGAVLGTPAYMAPEQFLGAGSDPRTDQFAYCVTAWQLLTGQRPFRGDTLDELRKAASSGVANVKGDLPGAVRAVLARGLAAEPEQRWLDMNALLAALERAKGRTRRRVQIAIGVAALAVTGGVAVKLAMAPSSSVVATGATSACDRQPEDELASAWSSTQRDRLRARFPLPNTDVVVAEIDAFATKWIESYRRACTGTRNTITFARLGCLLGQRDYVAGVAELIPTVPQNVIEQIEMGGVLPRPQACDGSSPVGAPALPEDPALRDKIRALRPKLIAVRWEPAEKSLAMMPQLMKEAEALGWDPLVAEAHQSWGIAGERTNQWELTRDHYRAAFEIARRSHHEQIAAEMAVAMLAGEIQAVTDPSNPNAFDELATQARQAVKAAGDDPHFLAQIEQLEATNATAHGRFDEAIVKLDHAHDAELAIHNVGVAIRDVAEQALVMLRRDRPGDVDLAWQRLNDALRDSERAKQIREKQRGVVSVARYVAEIRGDLVAAHALADRSGHKPTLPDGAAPIAGRVVDASGKPVAGAIVVAWSGELVGDATRVYQDPHFLGDIVTTAGDGTFSVRGVRDGAIIAELGEQRSQPRLIGEGEVVLALAPTRSVASKVSSDDEVLTGIIAFAHYSLGKHVAWELGTIVARTHELRIAGLPAGPATLRLASGLDPNQPTRKLDFGPVDKAAPQWPTGPRLDVVVRGVRDATIFVFRDRRSAKTRADLEQLFEASTDATAHEALVIGIGDQTPEGMKLYQRNDQHGVVLDNRAGTVTVCAAEKAPASPAVCKLLDIPKTAPVIADGHGQFPTLAVVLQH